MNPGDRTGLEQMLADMEQRANDTTLSQEDRAMAELERLIIPGLAAWMAEQRIAGRDPGWALEATLNAASQMVLYGCCASLKGMDDRARSGILMMLHHFTDVRLTTMQETIPPSDRAMH